MFQKILIANRGEIACRIIKTARRLGITTVAVYSEVDANAMHVRLADEAYCIGPANSQQSYLAIEKIIDVAKKTAAQAIHPGYGFLSENTEFAKACAVADIVFIGPSPDAIATMGSKSAAKTIIQQADLPIIPGYHGKKQDLNTLVNEAEKIGYPILLKASAGGGGKGMRLVEQPEELKEALAATKREALSSFSDDKILIEKYLVAPRHIEVQIFADTHGNCVYLWERDCSIQRRNQKVLEEAPAPGLTVEQQQALGETAVKIAQAVNYVGAGTIEFLFSADGSFYFMEMNTRLQVEHPITEMITQLDLVKWQLLIATGHSLPLTQQQIPCHGHAFEARIYAEDPNRDFLPSIGRIIHLQVPQEDKHVRIDTGIEQGDSITPYYDPMIAKLCVWDINRQAALQRLREALADYHIVGCTTNIHFLLQIINHDDYEAAKLQTDFINEHQADLSTALVAPKAEIYALATLYVLLSRKNFAKESAHLGNDPHSAWYQTDNWRLNLKRSSTLAFIENNQALKLKYEYLDDYYQVHLNGQTLQVNGELHGDELRAQIDGKRITTTIIRNGNDLNILGHGLHHKLSLKGLSTLAKQDNTHDNRFCAPMPGTIVAIMANENETAQLGDALIALEAMKMEHTIYAPQNGIVKKFHFQVGDQVNEGDLLLEFSTEEEAKL